MAQHQLNDGVRLRNTKTLEQSMKVIDKHIARIRDITGGYDHVALGTDFDGFIKPTMGGLETSADLSLLEDRLRTTYGADADRIASDNALRVLRKVWT
jgi:microsomal dipeptidase-like Zn-dependent dipeptidase